MRKLLLLLLLLSFSAAARRPAPRRKGKPPSSAPAIDPARFFAARPGLLRIYEGRSEGRAANPDDDNAEPPAGASCEVI